MEPTLDFLWKRYRGEVDRQATEAWAIAQLEAGHDSDALRRLTDAGRLDLLEERRLLQIARSEVGLGHLNHESGRTDEVRRAWERENIAEWLAGGIDGWTLIHRQCELLYDVPYDPPTEDYERLRFWSDVAEDASGHGGQGISLTYDFDESPVSPVLHRVLLRNEHYRPLVEGTEPPENDEEPNEEFDFALRRVKFPRRRGG